MLDRTRNIRPGYLPPIGGVTRATVQRPSFHKIRPTLARPTEPVVKAKRRIDWTTTTFLLGTPLVAAIALPIYIASQGIHLGEVLMLAAFFCASGLGITMGYHRLFTHRTYRAHPLLKGALLIAGAWAFQHSALKWSANHRLHHRYVDTEKDPHNAKLGFWNAHLLWLFRADPPDRTLEQVDDLLADPMVRWQHRNYVAIAVSGMILPAVLGLPWGLSWGFFLWGGLLRAVLVHQSTFLVNSAAHLWGKQTFDDQISARDSWWVAPLTFGEGGYHSFHHRFEGDYRNGVRWYHWDPTKWLIFLASRLGLAKHLRRTSEDKIDLARLPERRVS